MKFLTTKSQAERYLNDIEKRMRAACVNVDFQKAWAMSMQYIFCVDMYASLFDTDPEGKATTAKVMVLDMLIDIAATIGLTDEQQEMFKKYVMSM